MRLRAAHLASVQSSSPQSSCPRPSSPQSGAAVRGRASRLAAATALGAGVFGTLICGFAGISQAAERTSDARGGVVRVLDRITGAVSDLELSRGEAKSLGRLVVLMDQCRYPSDDPASDAFAHLTVTDELENAVVFSGWMVASSPALSALDHPRYDVWVLHCDTPEPRPKVQETPDTGEDDPATEDGAAE